jgi:hypothetical protein
MPQVSAACCRPLLTVRDRQMPVLWARGGHGRRGPTGRQRGGDGHKLNWRVRPVRDDHLIRWQEARRAGGRPGTRPSNLSRLFSPRSRRLAAVRLSRNYPSPCPGQSCSAGWRTISPPSQGRVVGGSRSTRRHLYGMGPLLCEHKHGHRLTSSNAATLPLTLASGVVVCRLLPVGCRVFAACAGGHSL